MLDFIKILLHLFAVLACGLISIKLIYHKFQLNLENFALLYGLGSGFLTLEMLFLSLAGIKFSLVAILIPWAILLLLMFINKSIQLKEIKQVFIPDRNLIPLKKFSLEKDALVTLLFIFVLSISFSEIIMGMPLAGWDAWAHWGYKGKIFYLDKGIPWQLYYDNFSIIPIKEYPLLVNLSEAFFYNFLGRFDDSRVKIIFIFFYISLLIYFYALLKNIYGKNKASLFTLFFATIPMLAEHAFGYFTGYADLLFTYYNFISVISLWLWSIHKKKELFYISSIFTGFALWTKLEGIILLVANSVCVVFLRRKLIFRYILIPLAIAGFWYLKIFFFHFSPVHISAQSFVLSFGLILKRFTILCGRFWSEALQFSRWNIFWLLFILLPLIYFRRLVNKANRFILSNLLLQLALYFIIIILDQDFGRVIWNSLNRLMLHLTPLVVVLIIGSLGIREE